MNSYPSSRRGRSPRRAAVLRALMSATALGMAAGAPLLLAPLAAVAQPAMVEIDLPALPMAEALSRLSRLTGLQIAYDSSVVSGLTSPAVAGRMAPSDALYRVISGSGLDASFIGDRTVSITRFGAAGTDNEGAFLLDPIRVQREVEGYSEATTFETAGSVTYYSPEEIDRFRGTSVGDFLKGNPGVLNGDNRNSGALDVNVRGMQGQGRVPVVIDGAFQESTVYRGYSGIAGRTYLDPDLVGSVAIEKGPSSGADGAGATGGVVRVSTLKPADIIPEGQNIGVRLKFGLIGNASKVPETFTVGAGNGSSERMDMPDALDFSAGRSGSIAIAQRFGNFEFLAAYARRDVGNYFAGSEEGGPDNTGLNRYGRGEEVLNTSQDNTSYLLRGIYSWGDGQSVDLAFSRYESDYGELMPSQIIRFNSGWQSPLSHVDVDMLSARYRWNPEANDLIDLKVDVFGTSNLTNIVTGYGFSFGGIPPQAAPLQFVSESKQWGISLSNTSRLDLSGRPLTLDYGLSWRHESLQPPDNLEAYRYDHPNTMFDVDGRDGWRNAASAFVSARFEPSDRLTLEGSLRYVFAESQDNSATPVHFDNGAGGLDRVNFYNHQKTSGTAPIFSALYQLTPDLQIYGRYAEAYRTASLFETTKGFSAAPDPLSDLRPEHAKLKEVGVNYQRASLITGDDLFQAKLAVFDNLIEDYITRGTPPGASFANIKHARLRGAELSLRYDSARVFAELTATRYSSTEYCDDQGVCLAGGTKQGYVQLHVPPEDSATLTLGGRFMQERLELGTRISYIGDRAATTASSSTGGYTTMINWEPYTLVDVFGSYQVNDLMSIDFAVDNVTNQYYMDSLTLGLMPSPGRTVRFGLTANF